MKRAIFEHFAGYYDAGVSGLRRWRDDCGSIAEHLPPDALRVLDLGTGPGVSAFAVAERAPAAQVLGLDFARRMLLRAVRHRDGGRGGGGARRTHFAQADARRLPLCDGAFDAVVGHSFLYLVPQRAEVLREVRRALRPGGRAVFLEPRAEAPAAPSLGTWLREPHFAWIMTQWHGFGRWEGRFTEESLTRSLMDAGLRPLRCEPRLDGFGWLAVAERAE